MLWSPTHMILRRILEAQKNGHDGLLFYTAANRVIVTALTSGSHRSLSHSFPNVQKPAPVLPLSKVDVGFNPLIL